MTDRRVRVGDFPQLRLIAWHLDVDTRLRERDALRLYERHWRHVGDLTTAEAEFIQHLADTYSGGRLLV